MGRRPTFRLRGKIPDLAKVSREVQRRAMPRIVEAVTEQTRKEAPQRRGYGSGKSIVSRIQGKVIKAGEQGIIKSNAPHSHLVHFGVKPHSLGSGTGKRRRKRGKVLKVYGTGDVLRRGAQHPGHGKNEYMWRGLERSDRAVDRILKDEGDRALQESIDRAVERIDELL